MRTENVLVMARRLLNVLLALTALFLFVVFSILFYALKVGVAAWGNKERTDKEAPFQAVPDA